MNNIKNEKILEFITIKKKDMRHSPITNKIEFLGNDAKYITEFCVQELKGLSLRYKLTEKYGNNKLEIKNTENSCL